MKRIYIVMLFAALATITYAQTDDKGYQEGAWVLKGVTGLNMSQTAMANWSSHGRYSDRRTDKRKAACRPAPGHGPGGKGRSPVPLR